MGFTERFIRKWTWERQEKKEIIQREFDKKTTTVGRKKNPQRDMVKSSNLGEKNMWCCVVVGAKEDGGGK